MNSTKLKAVCFGEVLWDVFPTHEKIGGAPLNLALRLANMGISTSMISNIGKDAPGKAILDYLRQNKIDTNLISTHETLPTGKVKVKLDNEGSASYTIEYPVAWDKIELTKECKERVKTADVFIFGSLASRDIVSRNSLFELLQIAPFKVLDINLRAPHYEEGILKKLTEMADFIKFNDDELFEFAKYIASPYNSLEQNLDYVIRNGNAKSICVTKGGHGAVLYHQGKLFYNSGYKIKVKDTVGAGDSFLAVLISKLLNKTGAQESLDFACAVGALVASKNGANPILSSEEIETFMFPIK